jgi:hypothetical protein
MGVLPILGGFHDPVEAFRSCVVGRPLLWATLVDVHTLQTRPKIASHQTTLVDVHTLQTRPKCASHLFESEGSYDGKMTPPG